MTEPLAFGALATGPDATTHRFGDWPADAPVRVASISKLVTAGVCRAAGMEPSDDLSQVFGWRLRHPDHPDLPITAGMVAAHHAGLSDAAGYAAPGDRSLADWLSDPAVWGARPGTVLSYCNLGYTVLAGAAEALTGKRFGDLAAAWLQERDIPGGFNWWGVGPQVRARALPCLRPGPDGPVTLLDGTVPATGLVFGPEGIVDAPEPGKAPWLWSAQGGLRISLEGCLRLAQIVSTMDTTPLWTRGQGPVDGPEGVYQSWGFGLQILDDPPHWPRPLIGHFADAYGVRGGVFHDGAAGISFAYLMNGVAEETGPDADDFSPAERRIIKSIADQLAESA